MIKKFWSEGWLVYRYCHEGRLRKGLELSKRQAYIYQINLLFNFNKLQHILQTVLLL